MAEIVETSWYLDWSALPQRLLWARLQAFSDGSAAVLDLDGRTHRFQSVVDARIWLAEDEYSRVEDLIEAGEVEPVSTPQAASDKQLVPLMLVRRM